MCDLCEIRMRNISRLQDPEWGLQLTWHLRSSSPPPGKHTMEKYINFDILLSEITLILKMVVLGC